MKEMLRIAALPSINVQNIRKAGDKERRTLLTVGEGEDIFLGVDFPFVADCRAINVCEHVIQKQILTD